MKFSYHWLQDHLETRASAQKIAETLSLIGFEVDHLEDTARTLKDITVADVLAVADHPSSDHLHVCTVDDGSGTQLQIVCGAPNVYTGMKTALVHVGGIVPQTGTALKPAKIRGVESQGMLCSRTELGLEPDVLDGIIDLSSAAKPGTPISSVLDLDDQIFTISITPNRGDCFSVRGIARELAAAGLGTLKPLSYAQHSSGALPAVKLASLTAAPINVQIQTPACAFYIAAIIDNVQNAESPAWMQSRLRAAGQKPINLLVDLTNFLCFDLGQPMHVYDADRVVDRIDVRPARPGEKLMLLNGESATLSETDIVIADSKKALTLAGIMGGEESGTGVETRRVVLEVAHFDPVITAKSGQKHQLRSESRTRFERGVDPQAAQVCAENALALIQALCSGKVLGCTVAKGAGAQLPGWNAPMPSVKLTQTRLQSLSGDPTLSLAAAELLLLALGMDIQEKTTDQLIVNVPSWRHDIALEEDLIEEVLRLRGYNRLPATPLPARAIIPPADPENAIKTLLCNRGLNEIYTLPFLSTTDQPLFADASELIEVLSPLNKDMCFLRPTLVPSLLGVVRTNQSRSCKQGAIFEIESAFRRAGNEPEEMRMAAGVRFGNTPKHWLEPSRAADVFDAKADLCAALALYGVKSYKAQARDVPPYYHPHRAGAVVRGRDILGYFGEIHPRVLRQLDLAGPIVAFELRLTDALFAKWPRRSTAPYSGAFLQPVVRDFAFVVDKSVLAQQLLEAISRASPLIANVQVFDIFQGAQLGIDKKSVAIQVTIQPQEKTLQDTEIQIICATIQASVQKQCGGAVRDGG